MSSSLSSHLTRRCPSLPRSVVSKRAMTILSRQIEDLLSAAGPDTVLVSGFQESRHWARERERYEGLAAAAHVVALYADGDAEGAAPPAVPLDRADPLAEEWFVVALGDELSVALCARELDDGHDDDDGGRLFEAVLTTDPQAVRDALAFLRAGLAERRPDVVEPWPAPDALPPEQPGPVRVAGQNERLVTGLFAEIEALRQREHSARRAAERLHGQALDAARHERRRLAQTLHDDSLQYLLAAHQDLLAHAAGRPGGEADADPDLARGLEHLAHGLTHLRAAVSAIQPLRPDGEDLSAILHLVGDELGDRGGFRTVVTVSPAADRSTRALALLPVVRELLTNTAKHAGAGRVEIDVTRAEDTLALAYRDDGAGFDPAALAEARAAGHIGLTILADRVRALGGRHTLVSAPGAGVSFRATFPDPSA